MIDEIFALPGISWYYEKGEKVIVKALDDDMEPIGEALMIYSGQNVNVAVNELEQVTIPYFIDVNGSLMGIDYPYQEIIQISRQQEHNPT